MSREERERNNKRARLERIVTGSSNCWKPWISPSVPPLGVDSEEQERKREEIESYNKKKGKKTRKSISVNV